MTLQPNEFWDLASLEAERDPARFKLATVGSLRKSLGFMDSQGRSPTNRESLDVLSAIDSIRLGDALAARMFAHRALTSCQAHEALGGNEEHLYTTAQLRLHLDTTLVAAGES